MWMFCSVPTFSFFFFFTVWRIASISNQGEESALLGTSAFIYMHTLMEQRQMWGHQYVSDGIMLMVISMFFRWVNFGCRANGLFDLKRGMIFTYCTLLAKKFCCLRSFGCSQCILCLIWYPWRWGSEIGFVREIDAGMFDYRVANNIALLEMSFWLLCVLLKISFITVQFIEILKFLSNIYLQNLVRWWCGCKSWDSNNCVNDFSHLLVYDNLSFGK